MRSTFVRFVVLGIGIGLGYAAKAADAPIDEVASVATEPETARRPAACSFIDQQEMSRILGRAVDPPAGEDRGGSTTCAYTPAAGSRAFASVHVKIDWQGGEAAMTQSRLAESLMGTDAGLFRGERIGGVGDEATVTIGGVMMVRKGPTIITIDLGLQSRAKEKGLAIAQAILARASGAQRPLN